MNSRPTWLRSKTLSRKDDDDPSLPIHSRLSGHSNSRHGSAYLLSCLQNLFYGINSSSSFTKALPCDLLQASAASGVPCHQAIMLQGKQDLGRQGRGCPEAELERYLRWAVGEVSSPEEERPTQAEEQCWLS